MNGQLCMRTEEGNIYRRHYNDAIMGAIASQITSHTIVYWIIYSDADQRKHQSSASLAFVRGIHREPVNSPHKWPVTRKMFLFDDVIMDIPQITWYNRNDIIASKGQRSLKYKNLTHTPGWQKCSSFRIRCFQVHFRELDVLYFDSISLKFVPRNTIENNTILV